MIFRNRFLRSGIIVPLFLLIVTMGYLLEALRMAPMVRNDIPSESFYPIILSILMIPLCLRQLVVGLRDSSSSDARELSKPPLIIALVIGIFIFAFSKIGFLVTAPLFVFFFMLFFDDKPQKIGRKIISAILITAFVYVMYEFIFGIHFPELWRS
ncbi:tripartite tricarboxylate transporter TctB family protein [Marispirochaeta aestuarii]|uniref:tripartite tricarboxylate transporter TctB family protein n=1 Tax=Marispirochaeta aestuarii TaxID=1963862 RepID=UPI0029C89F7D|nr:tripartite tricarboxylate transporter TctB family protein [Marispirochaeta aestuarii]